MTLDLFDSPELLDIQRTGFYAFLNQGIPELLAKEFPIRVKNGNYSLELSLNKKNVKLIAPEDDPRDCILKMKTYSCKLYAQVTLVCKKSCSSPHTRRLYDQERVVYKGLPEWVLLGQVPMMTKRGHFIINGSPRVIVHQVVRSPGIYFQKLIKKDDQNKARFYGDIIPLKGVWVRLQMTKKGRVEAKFKKGKKVEVELLQKCLQVIENQTASPSRNNFFPIFTGIPGSHGHPYKDASVTASPLQSEALYDTRFLVYDEYSKLLDKKKSRAESKAEHDAFVHTYDKLYRTAQDRELEEWQKKKKNQRFFKNLFAFGGQSLKSLHGEHLDADAQRAGSYKAKLCACKGSQSEALYAKNKRVTPLTKQGSGLDKPGKSPHRSKPLQNSSFSPSESPKRSVVNGGRASSSKQDIPQNGVYYTENEFKRKKCAENLFATFKIQSRYDLGLLGREKINDKFGLRWAQNRVTKLHFVKHKLGLCKAPLYEALSTCRESKRSKSFRVQCYKAKLVRTKSSSCLQELIFFKSWMLLPYKALYKASYKSEICTAHALYKASLCTVRARARTCKKLQTHQNKASQVQRQHHLFLQDRAFTGQNWKNAELDNKTFVETNPRFTENANTQLTAMDLCSATLWLYKLRRGEQSTDDIDHAQNRRVRTSGELLQTQFENGVYRLKGLLSAKLQEWRVDLNSSVFSSIFKASCKTRHSCKASRLKGSRDMGLSYFEKRSFIGVSLAVQSEALYAKRSYKIFVRQRQLKHSRKQNLPGTRKIYKQIRTVPRLRSCFFPFDKYKKQQTRGVRPESFALRNLCRTNLRFVKGVTNLRFVKSFVKLSQNLYARRVVHNLIPPPQNEQTNEPAYKLSAKELFSTKPITGALREFFGSNPLSQYMDQTNPLAEITHKRRISSLGVGGVSRESAGMAIRGIHPTHYGRICPIETPEGKNAGLVNSLAFYTKVDQNGFLKTPYYRVFKGQVQSSLGFAFCSAKEELSAGLQIAPSDLQRSPNNVLRTRLSTLESVPVRVADNLLDVFKKENPYKVQLIAISPIQMISVATSLIPFLEHNDANRALMGSNMQRQAVPLMISERPVIGTGLESTVIVESGHITQSGTSGFVSHVTATKIAVDRLLSRRKEGFFFRAHTLCKQCKGWNKQSCSVLFQPSKPSLERLQSLQSKPDFNPYLRKPAQTSFDLHTKWGLCHTKLLTSTALHESVTYKALLCKGSTKRSFVRICRASKGHKICTAHALRTSASSGGAFTRSYKAPLCNARALARRAWASNPVTLTKQSFVRDRFFELLTSKKVCKVLLKQNLVLLKQNLELCTHKRSFVRQDRVKRSVKRVVSRAFESPLWPFNLPHAKLRFVRANRTRFVQKEPFLLSTVSRLTIFSRSNQNTCITEKPLIQEFDWIQRGDILSDCSASNNGELALGKNVLVAYIPWEGYNFEDAIVISERLVREHVYTSLHIERYVFQAQELKDGNEWFTKHLPGVEPLSIQHLEESGFPKIGSFLKEGEIIVGKIRYLNKKPSSPYERLLCDILGEKNFAARNKSLYVPKGVSARVVYHKVINLFDNDPENKVRPVGAPKTVHLFLGEKRVIQVGDKISGRHGNKGVISTILPRQDMPYLPDGTPIDIVLNPLGVPSRMNVGQVLECLLGLAASYLDQHFKTAAFDERYGVEASKSIVFLKLYQARLLSGQNWLFQVAFPGKTRLVDGRSGKCFDQWITVGRAYILKLIHMVSEKIHARSTGPYALITQQPLRGRSNKGGQRLGEMEVWALEGFGAAYTLQELLTKKSDDFFGRKQIVDSILPSPTSVVDTLKPSNRINQNRNILGHPEIFKVLLCELQALCLDLGVYIVTPDSFQRTFLGVVH